MPPWTEDFGKGRLFLPARSSPMSNKCQWPKNIRFGTLLSTIRLPVSISPSYIPVQHGQLLASIPLVSPIRQGGDTLPVIFHSMSRNTYGWHLPNDRRVAHCYALIMRCLLTAWPQTAECIPPRSFLRRHQHVQMLSIRGPSFIESFPGPGIRLWTLPSWCRRSREFARTCHLLWGHALRRQCHQTIL